MRLRFAIKVQSNTIGDHEAQQGRSRDNQCLVSSEGRLDPFLHRGALDEPSNGRSASASGKSIAIGREVTGRARAGYSIDSRAMMTSLAASTLIVYSGGRPPALVARVGAARSAPRE